MRTACGRREFIRAAGAGAAAALFTSNFLPGAESRRPRNIVLIYADDLGYGDVGCYGSRGIPTPNIDRLAARGLRFTDAHAASATCTPSRYSLLTGEYAWRRKGTGIAPGNAAAIIEPGRTTLASVLRKAGYTTAVVGKWHLGLGPAAGPDWNGEITHAPLDIGFDYSFILPATGDRVPCVYVENRRVVGLDPSDPIRVSYDKPIGDEPTGKSRPDLLKLHPSHGHDQAIVNGVSRIGYMTGGRSALWVDEDMADTLTSKAVAFIERNAKRPFFLYFATHDIHVPRVPHSRFAGKSGHGARGDATMQFDWCVGEIMKTLDRLGLADDTLLILSSDNGPVVDDGYLDRSVEELGGHKPAGPLRGGKYSAFDAGTRVPFIVRWPAGVKPGVTATTVSQVDLCSSFAAMTGYALAPSDAPDSRDSTQAILGKSEKGREYVVEQSGSNVLSVIKGDWKYIEPRAGQKISAYTNIELGHDPQPQLYNLREDVGEKHNLAARNPEKVEELAALLKRVREAPLTR